MATNKSKHYMQQQYRSLAALFISLKSKLTLFFLLWLLLILYFVCKPRSAPPQLRHSPEESPSQHCSRQGNIAPFYIYTLPPNFNGALLARCRDLNMYTNMCPHVANRGLGRPLNATWYATHQFIAEMIFHARAERHPCRVHAPESAEMFYVPFYGGLYGSSVFREAGFAARDAMAVELGEYLVRQPGWGRMGGRDHFLVIGRTAWDFMRRGDATAAAADDFGANRLLLLPPVTNMSILTVERHPWQGHSQFGIPYPSYFHPYTTADMAHWQDSIRRAKRTHLFSFVGGPRVGVKIAAVRDNILRQCAMSDRCIRVQCEPGSVNCHEPDRVMEVMKRSEFCMQAPVDSFTRRSVFDSVLAGCVPVFFSEHTAYSQYKWYFPARREEWSVFIEPDRWDRIEEELNRIEKGKVEKMREKVIEMIPLVTYAHPNASHDEMFQDAVDVALVELTSNLRASAPRDSSPI